MWRAEGFTAYSAANKPTYQQILSANVLEKSAVTGKLWERVDHLFYVPLQLFQLANLMEQESAPVTRLYQPSTPPLLLNRDNKLVQQMLDAPQSLQQAMALELMQVQQDSNPDATASRLKESLYKDDAYVKCVALSLWNRSFPEVAPDAEICRRLLQDKDERVRLELLDLLQHNQDPTAITLLFEALSNSSPLVRAEAATAVGKLQVMSARGALENLLQDPEALVRDKAATALFKLKQAE